MDKNKVTIETLMNNNDCQDILRKSKYKPEENIKTIMNYEL
jgi:hypothetical protein